MSEEESNKTGFLCLIWNIEITQQCHVRVCGTCHLAKTKDIQTKNRTTGARTNEFCGKGNGISSCFLFLQQAIVSRDGVKQRARTHN